MKHSNDLAFIELLIGLEYCVRLSCVPLHLLLTRTWEIVIMPIFLRED